MSARVLNFRFLTRARRCTTFPFDGRLSLSVSAYTGSMCGNKVVEEGEECDCGWDDECTEQCCNPQSSDSSGPKGCTLKPNAACRYVKPKTTTTIVQYKSQNERIRWLFFLNAHVQRRCCGSFVKYTLPDIT